jgi:transaldolase
MYEKGIKTMETNPLLKIREMGQSIWLDFLSRDLLATGKLQRLIEQDGLAGVTSNPAIFKEAIADTQTYDEAIRLLVQEGQAVEDIYQTLIVEDIRWAADVLRSVYNHTAGQDGFVSLEVSPHLAYNTPGTIEEARRLWVAVDRPNLFIKVPATQPGLAAIQQLISEGININVTLLFGLPRYKEVTQAYLTGLAKRAEAGQPIDSVCSVASFFLSRIDVLVDQQLEEIRQAGGPNVPLAEYLQGQVAIASAKIAYRMFQEIFEDEPFRSLAGQGAQVQRLLWASTSTKHPAYSDVKYIESLIGLQTINTMPLKTLEAYRDHGQPKLRLEEDLNSAYEVLGNLPKLDLNLAEVTQQLEEEGVQKFIQPHDELLAILEQTREQYRVAEAAGIPG